MKFRQVDKIFFHKSRNKFFREDFRVARSYPKSYRSTHVTNYSGEHRLVKLFHILMSHNKIQPILARLRKNTGKTLGSEVLKLINVQKEITPFFFHDIHAFHGRELNSGNKHTTQEARIVFANASFRQVHDKYFLLIHNLANINPRFYLRYDITNDRSGKELANLILNRRDCLSPKFLSIICKLRLPKCFYYRVFGIVHHALTVFCIREHSIDTQEGGTRKINQRENSIIQNIFHTRAPHIRPNLFEYAHEARRDQMFLLRTNCFKNIKTDWIINIRRIEIDHIIDAMGRNIIDNLLSKVPVRIHEPNIMTSVNIVQHPIFEYGSLSHPCLPHNIHVPAPIIELNPKLPVLIPEIGHGKKV